MGVLDPVLKGDKILVYDQAGKLVSIHECVSKTATTIMLTNGRTFLKSTGKEKARKAPGGYVQGTLVARRPTKDELAAAEELLAKQKEEKRLEEEARKKAAWDALPENTKLARTIAGWLDFHGWEKLQQAPVDMLKPLAQWIEEHRS
jgi:hypothetical protein